MHCLAPRVTRSVLGAALVIVMMSAGPAGAVTYVVRHLGTLDGTGFGDATGINQAGQVIGSTETAAQDRVRGFLYSGRVMTDLGTLPGWGGDSIAVAVNNAGQVAAYAFSQYEGGDQKRAFLYSGGQLTDLGALSGVFSIPTGINDAGQVVGWWVDPCSFPQSPRRHAFLYGGVMADLDALMAATGTLVGDGTPCSGFSAATAINASGEVVGYAAGTDGILHAFLYSGGGVTDLHGSLPDTSQDSRAIAINDAGQVLGTFGYGRGFLYSAGVATDLGPLNPKAMNSSGEVVGSAQFPGSQQGHAFLYSGGQLIDLGTLGGQNSIAFAVNDSGVVVGGNSGGGPSAHAFVYRDGVMVDLGAGVARAINNAGEVVGSIVDPFLATPCGDGVVNSTEDCDDGNTLSGDGCSATCSVESGWSCSGQPSTCTITSTCGDGVTTGGEQCDLGAANGAPDACCNADCTLRSAAYTCRPASGPCDVPESCTGSDPACPPDAFATAGAPCNDDANLCTADLCDGSGACTHPYEPDPSCTTPTARGATHRIINRPGVALADQVHFKWSRGPAVPLTDFASPAAGTAYAFCVYDATPSGPVPTYRGQPVGQCDAEPCWLSVPTGWTFTSRSGVPDGVTSITLKEGFAPGTAKLRVRAKGLLTLERLPLQMSPNVIAQVRTAEGKCWGAIFSTAMRNHAGQFIARSD